MRQRKITFIPAALAGLVACAPAPDRAAAVPLSERFDLCIRLPEESTLVVDKFGPDFDLGQIRHKGATVEVFVGTSPGFPGKRWQDPRETTPGFVLVGDQIVDGQRKLLLGHKRYARMGPVFVMFTGASSAFGDGRFADPGMLADCPVKPTRFSDEEKWREPPTAP